MKIKLFVLALFLLTLSVNAQNDGTQYLESLQTKFNSIEDFTANVNQSVNGNPQFTGKIFFKKENKFKIEYGNTLIVSDGVYSWNFNKKENKVIITTYEEDESVFSINFLVYQFPSNSFIKGEQEGSLRKLTLTPKNSSNNISEVQLWINKNDLIEKIQTSDPATGLIELKFSSIRTNQNLPDSEFRFTPPEGSRIIDLR